eukprot:GHVN01076138.1.p1 GENE.GHVN01076138.1~~GHVN01076138.1.p1  ORF type:complete len:340 (+),score=95.54 GHVN01076138.1:471-1490(+)
MHRTHLTHLTPHSPHSLCAPHSYNSSLCFSYRKKGVAQCESHESTGMGEESYETVTHLNHSTGTHLTHRTGTHLTHHTGTKGIYTARGVAYCEDEGRALGWKEIVAANYENRLRFHSTPEKVFEYFASIQDAASGDRFMSKDDFLKSINATFFFKAYPVSKGDEREVSVFNLTDANKDGRISFSEFLFFSTLLTTSTLVFETAFKLYSTPDEPMKLSREQFSNVMDALIKLSPKGISQRDSGFFPEPRAVTLDTRVGVSEVSITGLEKVLFGEKVNKKVGWNEFVKLRKQLLGEIFLWEFSRCGPLVNHQGQICLQGKHFARLLVAFVKPNQMQQLAAR